MFLFECHKPIELIMDYVFDLLDHIKIRNRILSQHFSEHLATVRLMSMSQFMPPDHNDCIIATEIVTSSQCDAQSEPSETSTEQLLHLTTIHDCPLFNTVSDKPISPQPISGHHN